MSKRPKPSGWANTRIAVFDRAAGRCQINGQRCTGAPVEVDHIQPVADGGNDRLDNLRAVCRACHTDRQRRGQSRDWV